MVYVYVLKSIKSEANYVGITKNVELRLELHNQGSVKSTKSKRPWKLVYKEKFENYIEARNREKYFKNNSGKEWLKRRSIL